MKLVYEYKNKQYEVNYYINAKNNTLDITKEVNVYLHGWQRNHEDFKEVLLNNSLSFDFINFGQSSKDVIFNLTDYTYQLDIILRHFKIKKVNLICHSFGGRVAINYARNHDVNKIILISSAGIRNRNIKYYLKVIRYKVLKIINKFIKVKSLYKYSSKEYLSLDDSLKKTFKNVVNKDLSKYLKTIKCNVLILNSIKDKTIKYSDGIKMNKLISNSKLIPFYNSGHFLFIEEKEKYLKIQRKFLEE